MKKIVTLAFVAIAAFLSSCQNDMKKEILAKETDLVTEQELARCANSISVWLEQPMDAFLNLGQDTSKYPIVFVVKAGDGTISIPTSTRFIPGDNSQTVPDGTPKSFAVTYAVPNGEMAYVDGQTGRARLFPSCVHASIQRLDGNATFHVDRFEIKAGKTARFKMTLSITEDAVDPEAVMGTYSMRLLGLPIKLTPNAPITQWKVYDLSSMSFSLSSATPPPGHQ
jgi:hypothetical protein